LGAGRRLDAKPATAVNAGGDADQNIVAVP
jgi:hypothetical protein